MARKTGISAIAGAAAALGSWLCIAGTAQAEVALFDGASGLVTIPSVSVGSATYVDVTLRHNGNLTFTLQGATLQTPNQGPGVATYDLATGVLAIPNVLVGCGTYTDVRLANNGSFTFSVQAATEKLAPITAPLAIRMQPANTNVNAGQAASFSVTAAGNAPFGYQWKRNGIDVPGATGPSYTTPALAFADSGALYSVVVSNGSGSIASANATVAVVTGLSQPFIMSEPVGFTAVSPGSTPTLRVVQSGLPPTYQWRRNGVNIVGATTNAYTLPPVTVGEDGAWYSVLVCAAGGCITSINVQIQVANGNTPPTAQVSAANNHSLALRADGSVWAWGQALAGPLGVARDGTSIVNQGYPAQGMCALTTPLSEVAAVAGGYAHSVAMRRDGTVWATGANGRGQLGDGTFTPRDAFVMVMTAPGIPLQNVRAIAVGTDTSHAVAADGLAWAWGNNQYQQLGDGSATDRAFPVPVRNVNGTPFTGVSSVKAGTIHTLWLKADGTVWAAGVNSRGQLGDGSGLDRANPVRVETTPGVPLTGATAISAGGTHSLALLSDGTAMAWGYSNTGALANNGGNSMQPRAAPVRDSAGNVLTGIVAVEGGQDTSYFLLADGSVLAAGAVAIGATTSQAKPAPMRDAAGAVFAGVKSISAQFRHALAIRTDNTVWGWGNNVSLNLADGTNISRASPVRVQGLAP
jgi:alpha-tubulin suppressor-like RCC1 family protein